MHVEAKPLRISLISDLPDRRSMLLAAFGRANSPCEVRRLPPGTHFRDINAPEPDLVLFDFDDVRADTLKTLQQFARESGKTSPPLLLITNPRTQDLLENEQITAIAPLSFSPFSLPALAYHTREATRDNFLLRLRRLYEYGTITVRLPQAVLFRENKRYRATA